MRMIVDQTSVFGPAEVTASELKAPVSEFSVPMCVHRGRAAAPCQGRLPLVTRSTELAACSLTIVAFCPSLWLNVKPRRDVSKAALEIPRIWLRSYLNAFLYADSLLLKISHTNLRVRCHLAGPAAGRTCGCHFRVTAATYLFSPSI